MRDAATIPGMEESACSMAQNPKHVAMMGAPTKRRTEESAAHTGQRKNNTVRPAVVMDAPIVSRKEVSAKSMGFRSLAAMKDAQTLLKGEVFVVSMVERKRKFINHAAARVAPILPEEKKECVSSMGQRLHAVIRDVTVMPGREGSAGSMERGEITGKAASRRCSNYCAKRGGVCIRQGALFDFFCIYLTHCPHGRMRQTIAC